MGSERAVIEPSTVLMNRRMGAGDFSSRGINASVTRVEPSRLTEIHSVKLSTTLGSLLETPALLIRMSSFPYFSLIRFTAASIEEGFVTSSSMVDIVDWLVSSELSALTPRMTWYEEEKEAIALAVARPKPRPAPV